MRKKLNNKGYTIVGTLIVITALGYMGAAMMDLSSTDTEANANEVQSIQSVHVGGGGIQYALNKLDKGSTPDTQNKSLGAGTFTITSDPDSQLVTVSSTVGPAKKKQTITANFSKNNADLFVTGGTVDQKTIKNVTVSKNAGRQVIISGVTDSWNWNDCVANLS